MIRVAMKNFNEAEKLAKEKFGVPFRKLTKRQLREILPSIKYKIMPLENLKIPTLTVKTIYKEHNLSFNPFAEDNGEYFTNGHFIIKDRKAVEKIRNEYKKYAIERHIKTLRKLTDFDDETLRKEAEKQIEKEMKRGGKVPVYDRLFPSPDKVDKEYIKFRKLPVGVYIKYNQDPLLLGIFEGNGSLYAVQERYIVFLKKLLGQLEFYTKPVKDYDDYRQYEAMILVKDGQQTGAVMPVFGGDFIEKISKQLRGEEA